MKYGNVEIYKYSELSDEAKHKARENFVEHWMNHDWWDCTIDFMKEEGHHKHGFRVDEIRFSGFWSQGDGASWCGAVSVKDWIASKPTTYQEFPTTQIVLALIDEGWIDDKVMVSYNTSRYCHENTMDVSTIGAHEPEEYEEEMQSGMFKGASTRELMHIVGCKDGVLFAMDKEIEADCKAFAREIYRALEEDYESEISEESVAETYEANGAMFGEGGNFLTLND